MDSEISLIEIKPKTRTWQRRSAAAATTAVLLVVLYLLQLLLMPKYSGAMREGSLISEYYDETTPHDVIFVGDCEVYENFSPIKLWEDYGITSYIRGSAQQLIWQSYYLLEETLRYETPKVVVFNVLSMKYGEPQNEAYNRMTLDGMRWSDIKLKAIEASMTDDETLASYIFPLLRFHSRWSEVTADDFSNMFSDKKVSHNGYLMRTDIRPVTKLPAEPVLTDYTFSDTSYRYLDMMTQLCKERGIQLVLIKSASVYPCWYDEWDQQIEDYAAKNGLTYINFLEHSDETGIDMRTDTYDMGLHLNLSGAEKSSAYLGGILSRDFGLADHRGDTELSAVWSEKVDAYNAEKAAQAVEIAQYGYLKSLTVEFDKEEP
jgi:hypothetical protein